jgi:type I restriction-modification system DNA methylase subunit
MSIERWNEKASLIWSVADKLRGPYRPNQYKDVMLPMLVLRRLDCVLAPTKEAVLAKYADLEQRDRVKALLAALSEQDAKGYADSWDFEKILLKEVR